MLLSFKLNFNNIFNKQIENTNETKCKGIPNFKVCAILKPIKYEKLLKIIPKNISPKHIIIDHK